MIQKKHKPSKKLKIGELYNIIDYSMQIEVDYGLCFFCESSKEKRWYSTDKKTNEKIFKSYDIFNFFSIKRNEYFHLYKDDLDFYGNGMCKITDINNISIL